MNFWILAVALLAIPAAILGWPLFAGSLPERITGILLLLLMPLVGLILYQQTGNPMAMNPPVTVAPQTSLEDLVADLQQRMTENPDDAEGWVMLGRSLKTMRRYAEAQTALANANRLQPGNPLIMVEFAEASLFASGKPEFSDAIQQLLADAIEIEPLQQKGLWLLGMAATQNGNDEKAIAWWQKLLNQVDPASSIGRTVSGQIEHAQARIGQDPAKQASADYSLVVNLTLADELAGPLPESAVLFVFMRPAGQAGMPLAVKRIPAAQFPLSMTFSDADLLRPGASLGSFTELDISARISMTGIANIASGDYQADTVKLATNSVREIALHIDQRAP